MRRIILTILIALTALGGVASADRDHRRDGRHDNGGVRVTRPQQQGWRQDRWRQGRTYVQPRHNRVQPRYQVVRRPIYVQRPVIRYHYYNYYRRPTLIVENYPARPGYLWVAGHWYWGGYEWLWQAGYYQPDPAYNQYDGDYDAPSDEGYNHYDY